MGIIPLIHISIKFEVLGTYFFFAIIFMYENVTKIKKQLINR